MTVPRSGTSASQQHRLDVKRHVAVGFVHGSAGIQHEFWVGHELRQIGRTLHWVQGLVGVGPHGGLRVHEDHLLFCGCGVATGVHHRVHTVVHQVARNAQAWLDVRGDGDVFPSHGQAGAFAKEASVQHPEVGLDFSHDGVLHVGSHHHASVSFVIGVLHLKDVRGPQVGCLGVGHRQREVFNGHVAAAIDRGDFAVDGVARPFVVHDHLGVHPRNFHSGVDVVVSQRPSVGGHTRPNPVGLAPIHKAAVGHGQSERGVFAVGSTGHVQHGVVELKHRSLVVGGVKGLHENGFVAASVHGGVGPSDQTVGAAPFFLHGLGEGQIDTCTIFRLHRNHTQVAARDADVDGHVVERRALCVLHCDDLRVLRHVAGGVCGGPGAVDLELRAARPVDDLLEELNRATEVVGGGVAAGVIGVPVGTVVIHVDARHLDEPIGAVRTDNVAPLQGHVLWGTQEDRRGGVHALPEL